jgi:hypothetical protein
MDRQTEFDAFVALMGELAEAFHRPCTEELVSAYWKALKDCRLSELRAAAQEIIRTATEKTPFPRPGALRARVGASTPTDSDGHFQAGLRTAVRTWRELKASDPIEFEIQFRIAFAARMIVTLPAGDVAHAEWMREFQHWSALRFATREAKAAAVAQARPLNEWARAA